MSLRTLLVCVLVWLCLDSVRLFIGESQALALSLIIIVIAAVLLVNQSTIERRR